MNYFLQFVKNLNMTDLQSLYLLIPAVIISILICPIFVKLNISFNILTRTGALSIGVYKFRLLYYKIFLKGKMIILENDKGVQVQEFGQADLQFLFIEELIRQLKQKLKLKDLLVFYNVGVLDAFQSAMLAGYINLVLNIIFSDIRSQKPTANVHIYDTVSYNREILEVMANIRISISVFDIVFSIWLALILSKKKAIKLRQHSM